MIDRSLFYSYNQIRSYNKWLNFIISNRGGGKTYGAKLMCIKDYIKTGEQFIYLRRYETELRTKYNFFEKIEINKEFPDYEFKVDGEFGYIKLKSEKKWKVICYFIPLSTSGTKYKGGDYPLVTKIIFDEFIINEGFVRYIKNEPFLLEEFYTTVDRFEDRCSVYCLGNKISLINPYFTYYDLYVDINSRFTQSKNKTIVVEMFLNDDLSEIHQNTRFGKSIKDTAYGNYAMNNVSFLDNDNFVMKRPESKSIFMLSLKVSGKELGVWRNDEENILYIDYKIDTTSKNRYVLSREDHSPDTKIIEYTKKRPEIIRIKKAANSGLVYYKDNEVKKLFYYALKYLN